MGSLEIIRRTVARVVLFDASNRVLLLFVEGDRVSGQAGYWYLPGGGMGSGETLIEAARRELREETGIETAELGPVVLRVNGVRFEFGGREFEQDEWHLIGRLPDGRVGRSRDGDIEAEAVKAHRWWSLEDLAQTSDLIHPRDLASFVEHLVSDGPPPEPWVVSES